MRNILERLSISELDARLHDELKKDNPDGEQVRSILRVLEAREKDYPVDLTPRMQAAWDDYVSGGPTKPRARNWVKHAAAIGVTAAVLGIVLLGVIPQPVRAETWWERMFNFTDSVFQFFNSAEANESHENYVFETDNPGLQEVYDAVVELGVTEPVVPMWLPEGYELAECKTITTTAKTGIYAIFLNGKDELVYKADVYNSDMWHEYHKDENEVTSYEAGGVRHNIMQNTGRMVAIWERGRAECFLTADCQEELVYRILTSIYTTEDKT